MNFSKKDLISALITGFTTGFIVWQILVFLNVDSFAGAPPFLLVIILPILWVLGVNFGYLLGRWIAFFNQFGKFAAIGFTNAAVDFGTLNLLIGIFEIASGVWFSAFKAVSFITALIHSYIWNRYWVFESSSQDKRSELFKFISVAIFSMFINVAIASFIVNGLDPMFGLDQNKWANIGAGTGSAVAFIFSFVGFRLLVFKKTVSSITN